MYMIQDANAIFIESTVFLLYICYSTMEKVTSAALQTTCVLLLMVELDGIMR